MERFEPDVEFKSLFLYTKIRSEERETAKISGHARR